MTPFPKIETDDFQDTVPQVSIWEDSDFMDVKVEPHKLKPARDAIDIIAEKYPRILEQIQLLWGTQELQDKFVKWVLIDQNARSGWPADVAMALIELEDQHARLFKMEGKPDWNCRPDRW